MQCCSSPAQSLHLTSVTGKTFFLEFACNLRSHCFGEGTRVEHFSDFGGFCSTFEATRVDFGVDGRQKSHILTGFCLLSDPRTTILDQPVDKIHTFSPIFVLLSDPRITILDQPVDKIHTFTPVFVYWPQRFKGDYGQKGDF